MLLITSSCSLQSTLITEFWQEQFSRALEELGLRPVGGEPCLFTDGDGILILFYVDDIILLSRKDRPPDDLELYELKATPQQICTIKARSGLCSLPHLLLVQMLSMQLNSCPIRGRSI